MSSLGKAKLDNVEFKILNVPFKMADEFKITDLNADKIKKLKGS
jgi:hypothetical protein